MFTKKGVRRSVVAIEIAGAGLLLYLVLAGL
jgi:hypothetical protein